MPSAGGQKWRSMWRCYARFRFGGKAGYAVGSRGLVLRSPAAATHNARRARASLCSSWVQLACNCVLSTAHRTSLCKEAAHPPRTLQRWRRGRPARHLRGCQPAQRSCMSRRLLLAACTPCHQRRPPPAQGSYSLACGALRLPLLCTPQRRLQTLKRRRTHAPQGSCLCVAKRGSSCELRTAQAPCSAAPLS